MFDTDNASEDGVRDRKVVFKTRDGAELVGRLYHPAMTPFAIVVLNAATGVSQSYYRHFARWLAAERGLACLTYDYRDMGASARIHPRQSRADMADWGVTDAEAARHWVHREMPEMPIWIIGHSLGAMLVPMQGARENVARVIGVASGEVHHSDHPWPFRAMAMTFWFGLGPLATAAFGYLPGRTIGFGSDLPRPAYWQWRRWCISRSFHHSDIGARLSEPRWGKSDAPVRLVAFSDDEMIPPHCVWRLGARYGEYEPVLIDPAESGLDKVGHLGVFAPRNKALWDQVLG